MVTNTNPPFFILLKYLRTATSLIRVLPIPVYPANKQLLSFNNISLISFIASSWPNLGTNDSNLSRQSEVWYLIESSTTLTILSESVDTCIASKRLLFFNSIL